MANDPPAGTEPTPSHQVARSAAAAIGLVASYVALAKAGSVLGAFGDLSVWYAPTGLALAAAVGAGWRAWPVLAVSEFLVGVLVFGIQDEFGVPLMVVNAVGYAGIWVVGGLGLRRLGLHLPVRAFENGGRVMAAAAVATPMVAALFGNAMRVAAGADPSTDFLTNAWIWYLGDAIGVVTIGPALLVAAMLLGAGQPARVPPMLRDTSLAQVLATTTAPTALALLLFLLVPEATGGLVVLAIPMSYAAVRFGLAGVALAAALLSPVATALADIQIGTVVIARTDLQVLLLGLVLAAMTVAVPVEQRRLLRQRLERSEQHLARAQEVAHMGSFQWDAVQDQVQWSAGLLTIFGGELTPAEGGSLLDAYLDRVLPVHRREVEETLQRVAAGEVEEIHHEYQIVRDDGERRWIESQLRRRTDDDGRFLGVTGTCLDVTGRRHMVEATARATERELEATTRMRQAEEVKDALLAAVSHEVRTPLTIILGLSETLSLEQVRRDPAQLDRLLAMLPTNVARLQQVLIDLLDTDRLGRGVIELRRRVTHLPSLVQSVIERAEHLDRLVDAEVAVDEALVDRAFLDRILWSLLTNAIRFTPSGGTVRIRLDDRDGDLLLVVDDEGPGVAQEHRRRIFERFHQEQRVAHSPGTGLGLHLVARFTDVHGGRAWVEDAHGGGASFRVLLPDAVADLDRGAAREHAEVDTPR